MTTTATAITVPILDLKALHATICIELQSAIERVRESQHLILGPEVERPANVEGAGLAPVALPFYRELREEQIKRVVQGVDVFAKERAP